MGISGEEEKGRRGEGEKRIMGEGERVGEKNEKR